MLVFVWACVFVGSLGCVCLFVCVQYGAGLGTLGVRVGVGLRTVCACECVCVCVCVCVCTGGLFWGPSGRVCMWGLYTMFTGSMMTLRVNTLASATNEHATYNICQHQK
jgi:hypothetical protein